MSRRDAGLGTRVRVAIGGRPHLGDRLEQSRLDVRSGALDLPIGRPTMTGRIHAGGPGACVPGAARRAMTAGPAASPDQRIIP